MNQRELKKYSQLAEIACDYYERGLSQNEIADRLCLSRTRVSRLLKEAAEKGIVNISINYSFERHYELEDRFLNRFPLKHVRILNNRNRDPVNRQNDVGALAATYIMESLKKDMIIGTSWGTTLSDTIKHVQPVTMPVHIVQLMGAVYCESLTHAPQTIVSKLTELLSGHGSFLNLPLYIEDDFVRQTMCSDRNNRVILDQGMFSDMILTSVSNLESIIKRDFWLGYMTPELFQEIRDKGAVGAMFARFFDKDGREVDCAWNRRCVSISFQNIKATPDVVVIAADKLKASAITSALRGKLIDTLIIDGSTASEILGLI